MIDPILLSLDPSTSQKGMNMLEVASAPVTVRKQSLIDWSVEQDRKVVAWISKVKLGYSVQFVGRSDDYFFRSFAEAKAFAVEHA